MNVFQPHPLNCLAQSAPFRTLAQDHDICLGVPGCFEQDAQAFVVPQHPYKQQELITQPRLPVSEQFRVNRRRILKAVRNHVQLVRILLQDVAAARVIGR